MHGGTNRGAPAGNQNAERSSGLYARHLPPGAQDAFEQATVGDLEREIRLARASCDHYLATHGLALSDRYVIAEAHGDSLDSTTYALHADVVLRHLDGIRKLELAREQLRASTGGSAVGALADLMEHLRGERKG